MTRINRLEVLELARPLIKQEEGLRLHAYADPATGGEPWTIGYGHTGGVRSTDTITNAQADHILEVDMAKRLAGIASHVTVPLKSCQAAALLDFVFNVGLGAFYHSTMLRHLNDSQYSKAAQEFDKWVHAGGKVMKALVRRRAAERRLFERDGL